ncbi:TetR/AcrR family transcriptional regulator [Atopomonas hussainii]|uniref:TetR/AcrR family transcriptional regulator n=1 Tax=Atopomonas hussainii TaxID=1429083 RepID=UPI0009004606|nr:TetR/AcrR family transcriptional regulator [Atopomonas hussainii]
MAQSAKNKRDTYHVGNLAPQLLSAAAELLAEVGPAKLSLRAVSERVGVSSTAAYHHFANRTELLSQLAAQGFDELGRVLRQRDEGASLNAKLRGGVRTYFAFARRNPALYQLMFGAELATEDMSPALRIAREAAFGELKQLIAEVLAKPLDSSEVRSAALASWSYTHGLASLVIHGVLQPPAEGGDEAFVMKGLQGLSLLLQVGMNSASER